MEKIGIFFGTETGTTRLVAKKLHKLLGAEMIGEWPVEKFVGLVIDQCTQGMYTDERLKTWVQQVKPQLLQKINHAA